MARLENCPTCGNQTSENAKRCPACGEPLSPGWADLARKQRERAAEESKRIIAQAVLAKKRSKLRKRLIWSSIFAIGIVWFVGKGIYDDYYQRNLKELNPAEYQRKIQDLEAQVAKVPASDFDENIRLYKELQELDPDNVQYVDKLMHYQKRQKEEATAKAKAEAARKAAEAAAEIAAEAERKRKGFHCLSSWDGSHRGVKKYTEERMRDPDSFEHIDTRITPVDTNGEHTLLMQYRARNGFGGMTVGVVTATIRNTDCHATILSIE